MYKFKPLIFTKLEPNVNNNSNNNNNNVKNNKFWGQKRTRPTRNKIPKARSGHRIVCNETFMYSFGGFNPTVCDEDPDMLDDMIWAYSKPLFKEIWQFNTTTHEWSLMANQSKLPNELASMAVILKDGVLVVHGGSGCPFGERNSNQTYLCGIVSGKFNELTTNGEKPEPQYGQALVIYDKYLYCFGGTNGYEYTCDVHRLDFTTNHWEAVYICTGKEPCEPTGRYRHELAFDGRRIFVFGGGTAEETFMLNEIPTFDVVTNKWTTLMTMSDGRGYPAPRRCHGIVQYTDEATRTINVVISGGYNEQKNVLSDVWRLNLQTLQWSCLPQRLPRPVYFHSATITPAGCMITFGGITKYQLPDDEEKIERTNDVHAMWLVIPKLTEICWLALNHYHPKLQNLSTDQLLKLGIPLQFIRRLKGRV